jgi:hypothetical protein
VLVQPPFPPPDVDNDPLPKRRGRRKLLRALAVLVVLAAVGMGAYIYYDKEVKDAPAGASEGDCIKINSASSTDADVQTIDCTDPAAIYRVAIRQVGQVCPDNAYDAYTETSTGAGRATRSFTLCLILNVKEGECLSGIDTPEKLARVDCAAPGGEATVATVVAGTADEAACGEQTTPVVYPKPPTTYCLGKPAPR